MRLVNEFDNNNKIIIMIIITAIIIIRPYKQMIYAQPLAPVLENDSHKLPMGL